MLMGKFDRPFEPDLGANLKQLLFEDINPLTEKAIDMQIRSSISRYEPRVTVVDLKVIGDADHNGYKVTLKFVIDTLSQFETVNTFIERIR